MIDNFNGIVYFAIFIVHFLVYAVYAFRTVVSTKSFLDKYGMDHIGAIMTRFFGAFFIGIYAIKISKLGVNEKTSIEGIITPGVLTVLSTILIYGLSDIIHSKINKIKKDKQNDRKF